MCIIPFRHSSGSSILIPVEIIRAPGAPDSTSGLSYPYGNELVNSIVEAVTDYVVIGKSISVGADFDFRKQLYIKVTLTQTQLTDQETISTTLYNCAGFSKYIGKTQVDWLQPGEFPKFDVAGFKEVILHLINCDIANNFLSALKIYEREILFNPTTLLPTRSTNSIAEPNQDNTSLGTVQNRFSGSG